MNKKETLIYCEVDSPIFKDGEMYFITQKGTFNMETFLFKNDNANKGFDVQFNSIRDFEKSSPKRLSKTDIIS